MLYLRNLIPCVSISNKMNVNGFSFHCDNFSPHTSTAQAGSPYSVAMYCTVLYSTVLYSAAAPSVAGCRVLESSAGMLAEEGSGQGTQHSCHTHHQHSDQ